MTSINKHYPLQVWLTTIIFAPLLFFLSETGFRIPDTGFLGLIITAIIFGCGLSVPMYYIFRIAFKELITFKMPIIITKLLLISIAITGMVATWYFVKWVYGINQRNDASTYKLAASCTVSIVIAGLSFRLKKYQAQPNLKIAWVFEKIRNSTSAACALSLDF